MQLVQQEFLQKPLIDRLNIASNMRDASQKNNRNKNVAIMDVTPAAIEEFFDEHHIDLLIHGHTHRPNVHKISNDRNKLTRYVLGDWSKESAIILKWDETGIELLDLADSH